MSPTIWISAGELSGDMHAALLLKALREKDPSLEFTGMGGPHLRQLGMKALYATEDLSVMGLTEVLGQLPRILRMIASIKKDLARIRPRALIVVDAPEFHFRVIKAARAMNIPVYYYISPKIWAWRQGRAEFIRKNVRRLISILPFEVDFYKKFGMAIDYVGNPLVDVVDYPSLASIQPLAGRVGFLPGSRKKEISSLLPEFGKAARILDASLPGLEYVCMRAPGVEEGFLRSYWPEEVPVTVIEPENRWRLIRSCQMVVAASGTVVLECALAGTPTIVTYKVSSLTYSVARAVLKIPFVSLPNLILGREVFPELLQEQSDAAPLAQAISAWLSPPDGRDVQGRIRADLEEVRRRLGPPGAPGRAAGVILEDLRQISGT